uniref:RAB23, member RAS onco family n=1 Tax=Equus caballus TaxID=9796 RepID=F7AGF4_HORSE
GERESARASRAVPRGSWRAGRRRRRWLRRDREEPVSGRRVRGGRGRFERDVLITGIKVGTETFSTPKMLEEDMEVAIKMVVVGNGAVGKSSMIQRYCKGIFTKDYKKTIGVDFLERQIQAVKIWSRPARTFPA